MKHPAFFGFISAVLLFLLPVCPLSAETGYHSSADSLSPGQSAILRFVEAGESPNKKSIVRVYVMEAPEKEPLQGATVLLRRGTDGVHGKVTYGDGRCIFQVFPAEYTLRVQMTGLQSLEKHNLIIENGKVYDLEILMVKN